MNSKLRGEQTLKNVQGGELLTIEQAVSKHFKRQRKLLGLSQDGVSKRCGLSRATYANFESGKYTPSLRQFIDICNTLYIPPQLILDEATEEL